MKRRPDHRRNRKKKHSFLADRAAIIAISCVVALLAVFLLISGHNLKKQIEANDVEKESLEEQIEAEESRTEKIQSLEDYYNSEDYIRQQAQDKLGLVEDGQIVFRSEN